VLAVVVIIAIAAGLIIVRSRKGPRAPPPEQPPAEPAKEPEEEDHDIEQFVEDEERDVDLEGGWMEEEGPVDLSDLEMVTKKCPNCKSPIDVEPSFDDKISLACSKCGSKGRIPNPYKDEIDRLRSEKSGELSEELPLPPPPPPPDD
jgi:hypothetical protein